MLIKINTHKNLIKNLSRYIFQVLLLCYLILLLIDLLFVNIKIFNINYLLIIIIISAVIMSKKRNIEREKITNKDYFFIIFLGIVGTIILFTQIKNLNLFLAYLISFSSSILIICLSLLILNTKNEKKI